MNTNIELEYCIDFLFRMIENTATKLSWPSATLQMLNKIRPPKNKHLVTTKGTNRRKLVLLFCPYLESRKEIIAIPRKKKTQTLEKLYVQQESMKEKLRKVKQREKILDHQARNARTHTLCARERCCKPPYRTRSY